MAKKIEHKLKHFNNIKDFQNEINKMFDNETLDNVILQGYTGRTPNREIARMKRLYGIVVPKDSWFIIYSEK
jgi:folate-dependent phosphoribosylglycinamide formyltransferase PurN